MCKIFNNRQLCLAFLLCTCMVDHTLVVNGRLGNCDLELTKHQV